MESLALQFLALTPEQKRHVHFAMCENAFEIWKEYTSRRGKITYGDSVVGLKHTVEVNLPADALECARQSCDCLKVAERYKEPICAMQEPQDLEFPANIEYAYYAIYNLFRKYALNIALDDCMILNQALSAEPDEAKWISLLQCALEQASLDSQ